MTELHRELRRPGLQRRVFSFASTSPSELVRARLSTSEIQYRALTYLPDELLANIPKDENTYSLFQGFQATIPEAVEEEVKGHGRRRSRSLKLLGEGDGETGRTSTRATLKKEKNDMMHRLEMLGIRKNMSSSEIRDIDNKIANLSRIRKIVLERLAELEQDEALLEHDSKNQ